MLLALLDLGDELGAIRPGGTSSRVGYLSCSWAQAIVSGLPPRMMSVPRPAMFVAMVTAPLRPAWATISASRLWCLALSTSCLMPRLSSRLESRSLFSIETVPTSTGRPRRLHVA